MAQKDAVLGAPRILDTGRVSPGSPGYRHAAVPDQLATAHHEELPCPRWGAAVGPFPGRWPRAADTRTAQDADAADAGRARDIAAGATGRSPWPRDDLTPLRTAADRAPSLYPGPVGALIHREIHAYLEVGHRFGGDALISQLAAQVLDTSEPGSEPDEDG